MASKSSVGEAVWSNPPVQQSARKHPQALQPGQRHEYRGMTLSQVRVPERRTIGTDFDVQRSLRALRVGTEAQKRLTLRKLHLRWWHCQAAAMVRILSRAGVPDETLKLIPEITQTCRICRNWTRPLPHNVASATLPDKFNERVEADIMSVYDKIVFLHHRHMYHISLCRHNRLQKYRNAPESYKQILWNLW